MAVSATRFGTPSLPTRRRARALPVAPMTSAEILEVENGKIVRGELIYDAQELRAAMAAAS